MSNVQALNMCPIEQIPAAPSLYSPLWLDHLVEQSRFIHNKRRADWQFKIGGLIGKGLCSWTTYLVSIVDVPYEHSELRYGAFNSGNSTNTWS